LVAVHRHQGKRCVGSKRHIIFDLTPAQHAKARDAAVRARRRESAVKPAHITAPRLRRQTAVRALSYPPVAPTVWLVKALRTPKPAQVCGVLTWGTREITATDLAYANMAIDQFPIPAALRPWPQPDVLLP
jgi:hypothetical protein